MLLRDRVVLVAGVGPGLGIALAERVVDHGARVVLVARSAERLADLRRRFGDRALDLPADLADADAAAKVVAAAVERFGRLDGLVYNAAVMPPLAPVTAGTPEAVLDSLAVSVHGPLHLVQAAAPVLASGSSIVMIGSAVVRHPKPGFGAYNVGKHALLGLARSLALELGPSGLRVNTLAAGKIDGDRLRAYFDEQAARRGVPVEQVVAEYVSRIALGRIPAPEEYADAVVFLLSDLSRAITGHVLDANGGEYFD